MADDFSLKIPVIIPPAAVQTISAPPLLPTSIVARAWHDGPALKESEAARALREARQRDLEKRMSDKTLDPKRDGRSR